MYINLELMREKIIYCLISWNCLFDINEIIYGIERAEFKI